MSLAPTSLNVIENQTVDIYLYTFCVVSVTTEQIVIERVIDGLRVTGCPDGMLAFTTGATLNEAFQRSLHNFLQFVYHDTTTGLDKLPRTLFFYQSYEERRATNRMLYQQKMVQRKRHTPALSPAPISKEQKRALAYPFQFFVNKRIGSHMTNSSIDCVAVYSDGVHIIFASADGHPMKLSVRDAQNVFVLPPVRTQAELDRLNPNKRAIDINHFIYFYHEYGRQMTDWEKDKAMFSREGL